MALIGSKSMFLCRPSVNLLSGLPAKSYYGTGKVSPFHKCQLTVLRKAVERDSSFVRGFKTHRRALNEPPSSSNPSKFRQLLKPTMFAFTVSAKADQYRDDHDATNISP